MTLLHSLEFFQHYPTMFAVIINVVLFSSDVDGFIRETESGDNKSLFEHHSAVDASWTP